MPHPVAAGNRLEERDCQGWRLRIASATQSREVSLDLSPAGDAGLSGSAGCVFRVRAVASCPAVAPAGGGSTGPGVAPSYRSDGSGWSAGREGLQPGDGGGDLVGPGPALGESEP